MARKTKSGRLSKAPLTEVVFELRWSLQPGPANEPVLQADPGLLPLLDAFGVAIKKQGFKSSKDMSHPLQTGAYGVVRRYYEKEGKAFPILQLGPGIFASNQGPGYDWSSFKLQTMNGLRQLIESYPKLSFFKMVPSHIEIRYVDVFGKPIVSNGDFVDFAHDATALNFTLPPMLRDPKIVGGNTFGRFQMRRELKKWKGANFALDLSSAKNNESKEDVFRMETKVVCRDGGIPQIVTTKKFLDDVSKWLEFAHDILSPFFKEAIKPAVMKKFGPQT
jgi:uncharacterized protein (TIGR04255 family)